MTVTCPACGMSGSPFPSELITGRITCGNCQHVWERPSAQARVTSLGKPCRCGPGFCAADKNIGYLGFCVGEAYPAVKAARVKGPDCPNCGAPHQTEGMGCWLCLGPGDAENAAMWLRALRLGVRGHELFEEQDRRLAARTTSAEPFPSCERLLDEIEAGNDWRAGSA